MKERMTDAEILISIIKWFKSVKISTWFFLYAFISFIIVMLGVYGVYDEHHIIGFHIGTGLISGIIGFAIIASEI